MGLERLGGRGHEEGQEGELRAVLGQEAVLGAGAQGGDAGDVDLDDGGQLRGGVQRVDHALGDDLAQAAHLLRPAAQRGVDGEIQSAKSGGDNGWSALIKGLPRIKLAIGAGILAPGSSSKVDLLLVGDVPLEKVKVAISTIERHEGRELNYSIIGYDEFFYRLSVRDRFVMEVLNGKHRVFVDKNGILNK